MNFRRFQIPNSLSTSLASSTPINADTIHKVFAKYFEVCWNSPTLRLRY